jgi:hypothetical protein
MKSPGPQRAPGLFLVCRFAEIVCRRLPDYIVTSMSNSSAVLCTKANTATQKNIAISR